MISKKSFANTRSHSHVRAQVFCVAHTRDLSAVLVGAWLGLTLVFTCTSLATRAP